MVCGVCVCARACVCVCVCVCAYVHVRVYVFARVLMPCPNIGFDLDIVNIHETFLFDRHDKFNISCMGYISIICFVVLK